MQTLQFHLMRYKVTSYWKLLWRYCVNKRLYLTWFPALFPRFIPHLSLKGRHQDSHPSPIVPKRLYILNHMCMCVCVCVVDFLTSC